jgi:ketosteroid isomerase-like protein
MIVPERFAEKKPCPSDSSVDVSQRCPVGNCVVIDKPLAYMRTSVRIATTRVNEEAAMKRTVIAVCFFMVGVALCYLSGHARAQNDDVAEIRTLEEGIANAAQKRDLATIMKNYPRGDTLVVFDVAPPRQYVGYESFQKDWQGFLDMFSDPISYRMEDLSIIAEGNMAYARMIQHVNAKSRNGKPLDLYIRVTDVLRKTNGKWLIIHEHASFPVNMKTGKADFLSKP